MKLFKRQESGLRNESPTRAEQRAALLDAPSLKLWMDSTIMGLGAAFDKWRWHRGPSGEVSQHLEALTIVWNELKKRENDEQ